MKKNNNINVGQNHLRCDEGLHFISQRHIFYFHCSPLSSIPETPGAPLNSIFLCRSMYHKLTEKWKRKKKPNLNRVLRNFLQIFAFQMLYTEQIKLISFYLLCILVFFLLWFSITSRRFYDFEHIFFCKMMKGKRAFIHLSAGYILD